MKSYFNKGTTEITGGKETTSEAMGWRCLVFNVCTGLRLTWREPGLCSVVTKAKCNTMECLDCHRTDHWYYVRINRSGSMFSLLKYLISCIKFCSLYGIAGHLFQGPNYTAEIGNAIHSNAKCPLKRGVCISEVEIMRFRCKTVKTIM